MRRSTASQSIGLSCCDSMRARSFSRGLAELAVHRRLHSDAIEAVASRRSKDEEGSGFTESFTDQFHEMSSHLSRRARKPRQDAPSHQFELRAVEGYFRHRRLPFLGVQSCPGSVKLELASASPQPHQRRWKYPHPSRPGAVRGCAWRFPSL